MSRPIRVLVVGAGPAGLLAAGSAARMGASVRLVERNSGPGAKLLITGKGRCNISNTASVKEFVQAFAPDGRFLYRAFSRFFREDLIEVLQDNGVQVKVERGGRLFPAGDKAADVLAALLSWTKRAGVELRTGSRCTGLLIRESALAGIKITGGTIEADRVILATGGASYPRTGSTGDGYGLAASVGHTVAVPMPSLVPLVAQERFVRDLEGISLRNVRATAILNGHASASEAGEMVFTADGLSGPIILTLSRLVVPHLAAGESVVISIDLKPAIPEQELEQRLIREMVGRLTMKSYLRTLLPARLVPVFLMLCKLDADKIISHVSAEERRGLMHLLKDLRFVISSARPLDEAIVTAGGIPTKEIDPLTMESRLLPGLYFAGEIIDIDGPTGGYNLQAAFSTGWLAGVSAAMDKVQSLKTEV